MRVNDHMIDIALKYDFQKLLDGYQIPLDHGKIVCPFHADMNPSLSIDFSTNLWHCFGCQAGGDIIHFVMRMENLEFPDAVIRLAGKPLSGLARIFDVLQQAKQVRTVSISEIEYLRGRLLSDVNQKIAKMYREGHREVEDEIDNIESQYDSRIRLSIKHVLAGGQVDLSKVRNAVYKMYDKLYDVVNRAKPS